MLIIIALCVVGTVITTSKCGDKPGIVTATQGEEEYEQLPMNENVIVLADLNR